MHVQVVTFGLKGISEADYHAACQSETGIFAELPGLLAKIWLRDVEANVFGAVYLWADESQCRDYLNGEIFTSIKNDPTLQDVASRDFDVYEDLTAQTHPGVSITLQGYGGI